MEDVQRPLEANRVDGPISVSVMRFHDLQHAGAEPLPRLCRWRRRAELGKAGLAARLMVDFSHANSNKQFKRQVDVARDVGAQIAGGDARIMGVMVESHLKEGRQDLKPGQPLEYGQSITDACIGWEDSLAVLDILAESVRKRRLVAATEN